MHQSGVRHDNFTFPIVNIAISSPEHGEAIHCLAIRMGFASDVYFCNTLIEMYSRCDRIDSAHKVFDGMPHRDLVSWTSMISACVQIGQFVRSLELLSEMRSAELEPNWVAIVTILKGCSVVRNAVCGRQLHGFVIKKGYQSYERVKNSILAMYCQTDSFEDAEALFSSIEEDIVSWNIMISGYAARGSLSKVCNVFNKVRLESMPSLETLTSVISAFAKAGNLLQGQILHGYSIKSGLNDSLLQTSLVDLYTKCGEMAMSVCLFDELEYKMSDSWSVLMSGFIHNGLFEKALAFFQKMQMADVKLSPSIVTTIVLLYSHLGSLRMGKAVHGYAIRNGFHGCKDNILVETSILSMHAKCGSIIYAQRCFNQMACKDVIAWSSMIEAYGIHGLGLKSLELFAQMQREGNEPNSVTFLSLLSACSHSGLVSEGCIIFSQMTEQFGIKPNLRHYTCLVDLLGRSGKLQKALSTIETMRVQPDSRIWGALLAACRTFSDNELGTIAAQSVLEMEPDNVGYHVVTSNVYVSGEKWNEAENLRKAMSDKALKKKPGWSCIETSGGLHGFVAGDQSHAQADDIWGTLLCLSTNMEEFGSIFD